MSKQPERSVNKAVDTIQERLTEYACALNYDALPPEVIHAAKVRIIDTLGSLIGGFFGEPCLIARNIAAEMPNPDGATIIGTRMKATPDIAAFVNGTAARYTEMTDVYHPPGSTEGQASTVIAPIFAAAENMHASGREFITSVVLGYEIYLRMADVFHNPGFDNSNFCCLSTALAAGKLMGLSPEQLAHCISMAVVPNNILRQVRTPPLSMWNVVASGQAGRSGVFAALLARAGMEGPHLPFEGKAGWCDHIARERFSLNTLGGTGTPFKILETFIKNRPSSGVTIPSILAAEKVAPRLNGIKEVEQVTVEVDKRAKQNAGADKQGWTPDSRETADHSIPYVVAATLMDGTVTLRSFNDTHLRNPELLALMQKIKVTENEHFTLAYKRLPQQHHARVTLVTTNGESFVGETGGDQDDLSTPKTEAQIEDKFRGLAEDVLGSKQINSVLNCLWHLESSEDIAAIPPALVLI